MYRVLLIDVDGSSIELDVSQFDLSVLFKVSELTDLSIRSSNRTKEISFIGNEINNAAFGHLYRLGRVSDLTLLNNLFFNTSALREIPCIIYENYKEIFRGTLRLLEVEKDKIGTIWYKGFVTDVFSDFAKVTQNLSLLDLDLTDLQHRYNITSITQSWTHTQERYSLNTSSFYTGTFSKGKGYVYPLADYGEVIHGTAGVDFNIQNFRPGVYTAEIFDRIFAQPEVKLQWEYRSSSIDANYSIAEKDKFLSQYVPNSQERLLGTIDNYQETLYSTINTTSPTIDGEVPASGYGNKGYKFINMNAQEISGAGTSSMNYTLFNKFGMLIIGGGVPWMWNVSNTFNSSVSITLGFTYSNPYQGVPGGPFGADKPADIVFELELIERPYQGGNYNNVVDNWTVIAKASTLIPEVSSGSSSFSISLDDCQFKFNTQIALRISQVYANEITKIYSFAYIQANPTTVIRTNNLQYTVKDVVLSTPKDEFSSIQASVFYGSTIKPTLPNIKQYDYIKSIMLKYNMFAYTEKQNPKKIIFQSYDDYYEYCNPSVIKQIALDWSNKVDYSSALKTSLNARIPKNYLYTYKEDGDYVNEDYKNRFDEVYGQFAFTDRYGVESEKKVELILSPTPVCNQVNNDMFISTFYKSDGVSNTPTKTNIRTLYYNGLKKSGTAWNIVYIPADLGSTTFVTASVPFTNYPQGIEYYTRYETLTGTYSQSSAFGLSRSYRIPFTNEIANIPNLYNSYHINQTTEITNSNLKILDMNFTLNEIDIANFNPRVPVFIKTSFGNSFYKVLEMTYRGSDRPATVKLQSIFFGLER